MAASGGSADELFVRGKELLVQGRYQEAAEVFDALVALERREPTFQLFLGISRFNSGDVAGSLAPAALAAYMAPTYADARHAVGQSLLRLRRHEDALRHLAHAARLGSDQARLTLTEEGKSYCAQCGGVVDRPRAEEASSTSAVDCPRCAGVPPTRTSPRPRIWRWSRLRADDYRSKLSLPSTTLNDIGGGYLDRYRQDGDAEDIEDAILFMELACATADEEHCARPLTELGTAYRVRYTCHGLAADIDFAIDCHEQALAFAPKGSAIQVQVLTNLGVAYQQRYELDGAGADLDRAIEILERALTFAAADWEGYASVLANAGGLYNTRFGRDHERSDIDRAIELEEQTVAITERSHARYAGRLSNFATSLMLRAERYQDPADLARSVEFLDRAVTATRPRDPAAPTRLANLGYARLTLYEETADLEDLERAIRALRAAQEATPDGSPMAARSLALLAGAHLKRDFLGETLDIDHAQIRTLHRRLAAAKGSPAIDRVRAGRNLGTLANVVGDHATATEILDESITILPMIAARVADWADRDQRYGQSEGLVSQAVAAHCAVGDLIGAVQIAELGRGVQLAAQLDTSSDLTDLEQRLPEYAQAFRGIQARLSEQSGQSRENLAPLWQRYESLLEQIRSHPGSERFLRVPDLAELRRTAAAGTVVMVNAGRNRSDAILIRPDGELLHVPLPNLGANRVVSEAKTLLSLSSGTVAPQRDLAPEAAHRRESVLASMLGWLWDAAVGPIRDALPNGDSPQRVWWLPIGIVGAFPFHAAGRRHQPGALDAFISSYTPTLRVLAHAHRRQPVADRRQLTVAVSQVQGAPTIPGTIAEARDLIRRHPDLPPLMDRQATVDQVKAALRSATWAHFACHASADYDVPSNSGLLLSDGVLSVPEISRLRLDEAELAYLSACSTAHRSERTIDESINLASAFHLAGFRHVVASLWPLNDAAAAAAARTFYDLAADGPGGAAAPQALRRVALDLRSRRPDRPDLWAALIHSGP